MTKLVLLVVLAAITAVFAYPSSAAADTGAYLDIATWPSIDASTVMGPEGVPQVEYAWGIEDNPVTVEQWALQHWTYYEQDRSRQADLGSALRGADWLLAHQEANGTWTYAFNFDGGGAHMTAPWISALSQGQAMSILVRIYDHTGDQRYLDAATRALAPFSVPADQGGVLADFDGVPWYEEYPTPALHVLNGFEFALVGLHDLADYSRDAVQLYEAGVTSLEQRIGVFDVPSARDELYGAIGDSRRPVVGTYPRIHATLTRYLATLTGNQTLADYANRWERYLQPLPARPKPTQVRRTARPQSNSHSPRTVQRAFTEWRSALRHEDGARACHRMTKRLREQVPAVLGLAHVRCSTAITRRGAALLKQVTARRLHGIIVYGDTARALARRTRFRFRYNRTHYVDEHRRRRVGWQLDAWSAIRAR